jgi:uncharacterized protein
VTDLPDINVWFALLQPNNDKHLRSQRYWRNETQSRVAFCQITVYGLLRLLTNHSATYGAPLSIQEAWAEVQRLRGLPHVSYANETAAANHVLAEWINRSVFTPRMWTDAHLAALAKAHNYRFVTFDKDFKRFEGVKVLILEPDPSHSEDSQS